MRDFVVAIIDNLIMNKKYLITDSINKSFKEVNKYRLERIN